MPQLVTTLAFILHVCAGTIALLSGTIAILARKGGALHRNAGLVFVAAMLTMAVFADYLAVVMPDQIVNLVIGTFAFYLVATAWLTVRRSSGKTGPLDWIALGVILCLAVPFTVLTFQLATGMPPFLKSAVPLEGPVKIAVFGFTTVTLLAAIADIRLMIAGGIAGAARIARHLWRMCVGLTLAAGSAFTNGLPHLLPPPHHVQAWFFYPQFIPLVLMAVWLVRVRLMGWRPKLS